MSDVVDCAQAREEEIRQDAVAKVMRRADSAASRPSASFCACGEAIPEERRKHLPGVQTCVECQRDIEKRKRFDWGMGD